jgi:restriction system protein
LGERKSAKGIDRIIKADRLGPDAIYIQARKWQRFVGRREIQVRGLAPRQKSQKGVFITTSIFSADAIDYVEKIDPKVVHIDVSRLAELSIDFNVGVTPSATKPRKSTPTISVRNEE